MDIENEIFMKPGKTSVVSIALFLLFYALTFVHKYASSIFGKLSLLTQIFFYLSLLLFILFIAAFIAAIVSFSNKFLYSRKL
jgi:hypothetical protein